MLETRTLTPATAGVVARTAQGAASAANMGNTVLATDFSRDVAGWFADKFNKNSNVYDTAIDAVYNRSHVGGSSLHHIVDGNHSLWGALKAAQGATPNDSFLDAAKGALEHLARDTCSVAGINPFFNVSLQTWKSVSGALEKTVGLSPKWQADMLTFNAPEVLGAGLAVVPMALGWNRLGAERFSEMAATLSIAAAASANPLLAGLALLAVTRSITKVRGGEQGTPLQALRGAARGAVTVAAAIAVSSLIGGPAVIGLALGLGAAVAVRKGFDRLLPASG